MNLLDFETYSPVPVELGSVKYVNHPDADIVCCGVKVNDNRTGVYEPRDQVYQLIGNQTVYAHNALFDYLVWNVIGVEKYGYPIKPLKEWIDVQALVNRYSYPGALDKVATILNTPVQKDKRGKALIKKICVPNANGKRPKLHKDYSQQDLFDFHDYCRDDVDSMAEVLKKLPADTLSEDEQYYWILTQEMNLQGLPVDIEAIEKIYYYNQTYVEEMTHRIPEITGGIVQKATQVAKIKDFVNSQGFSMANTQADTIEKMLERDDLTPEVEEILTLRQALGSTSTAKYVKLKDMAHNDRIFNNLHYYGAGPGRWAGRGFQMHNLPRASVENPEEIIEKFKNFEPVENPVKMAKALIRPMICAPEGRVLLVADYKSVENYLLLWQAGDWASLKLLKDGGDQYIDMASAIYNKPFDEVTKHERFVGKVIILGCGYAMGSKRLKAELADKGVIVTLTEAQIAIDAYRSRYALVKKMWYAMLKAAIAAIRNPGKTYEYKGCKFRVAKDRGGTVWLILTLPSGRAIYYNSPKLEPGMYGDSIVHMGINPYNKQWSHKHLIPGRLTENIIQGEARDCMAEGLKNVRENIPEVDLLGMVHDEGIGETDEDNAERKLKKFIYELCDMPKWAEGLPLKAEGYYAKRYRKE